MPHSDRSSWLNRRLPSERSRRISGVHLLPISSAVRATGHQSKSCRLFRFMALPASTLFQPIVITSLMIAEHRWRDKLWRHAWSDTARILAAYWWEDTGSGFGGARVVQWRLEWTRIMVRFIAYVVATVVATLALGTISDRLISFDRAEAVLLFGVVLGLINAVIKPVVTLIAFPLTCLTFGLFAIVINTVLFWSGAWITRNFDVASNFEVSWWGALLGSMLVSVASGIIFTVIDE